MTTVNLLFLKNSRNIFARLIGWWTESKYSHVELSFPDGVSYSADFKVGVVSFSRTYDPMYWDTYAIEIPDDAAQSMRTFIEGEIGSPYDWFGLLLSQVFKAGSEHPRAWFCSELLIAAFQAAGYFASLKPCTIPPGEAYKLCISRFLPTRL